MAMRSCRATWTLCAALFGGLVIALGGAGTRGELADQWDTHYVPGLYSENPIALPPLPSAELSEEPGPAPMADLDPMPEADHFDNGPVCPEDGDEQVAPSAQTLAGDDIQDTDELYRYEYPEQDSGYTEKSSSGSLYAEEYYYKYGCEYPSREDEPGQAESAAEEMTRHQPAEPEPQYTCHGEEYDIEDPYTRIDREDITPSYAEEGQDSQSGYGYECYYPNEDDYSTQDYGPVVSSQGDYPYGQHEQHDDLQSASAVEAETDQTEQPEYTYHHDEWNSECDAYQDDGTYEYTSEYQDEYPTDDLATQGVEGAAGTESAAAEEMQSAYDYGAWEYDYGKYNKGQYSDDLAAQYVEPAQEAETEPAAETDSAERDHATWEYEYSTYKYDYQNERNTENYETWQHEAMDVPAAEQVEEAQSAYDYDDWECEYGDSGDVSEATPQEAAPDAGELEMCDVEAAGQPEVAENQPAEPAYDSGEWEYQYACPEERYGHSGYTDDGTDSQADADEGNSDYMGYSEAYPEKEYAYPQDEMNVGPSTSDEFSYSEQSGDDKQPASTYEEYGYEYQYDAKAEYMTQHMSDDATSKYEAAETYESEMADPEAFEAEMYEREMADPEAFEAEMYESEMADPETYEAELYESEMADPETYEAETYQTDDAEFGLESDIEGRLESELGDSPEGLQEAQIGCQYAEPYGYYGYDCYGNSPAPSESPAATTTYDYADEYEDEYDGSEWMGPEVTAPAAAESAPESQSGLELFAWRPSELLLLSDQEILKTLETLCEEPSGVRRATLNDYLEAIGWEAIALGSRFEDVTGMEVLSLADDLPGAAALLATFRLFERGELGMDEAVDLLRRSLQNLSPEWIQGVGEITSRAYEQWEPEPAASEEPQPDRSDTRAAAGPVMDALVSLATRSLAGLGAAICSLSRGFAELDWSELAAAAADGRSAANLGVGDDSVQR